MGRRAGRQEGAEAGVCDDWLLIACFVNCALVDKIKGPPPRYCTIFQFRMDRSGRYEPLQPVKRSERAAGAAVTTGTRGSRCSVSVLRCGCFASSVDKGTRGGRQLSVGRECAAEASFLTSRRRSGSSESALQDARAESGRAYAHSVPGREKRGARLEERKRGGPERDRGTMAGSRDPTLLCGHAAQRRRRLPRRCCCRTNANAFFDSIAAEGRYSLRWQLNTFDDYQ
ncbi:hypothetical protein HPB47_013284 [Ixodes persulcatus]|uniref:Uncharacterized protein n=1 Tax=Ixodes persulcatus TaxID=34615 RepID=A0AC60R1F5_IXOPE|nr:hypothetical protein HPB47_013284 [Ixodes persulcatus]